MTCRIIPFAIEGSNDTKCAKECGDCKIFVGELRC